MPKKNLPPQWTSVYPQGTKIGDEEQGVFVALNRNPKWQWRSVAQIATEAKLTKERTEQILEKYRKKGMTFQSPSNDTMWAYWEKVPEMIKPLRETATQLDHKDRISRNGP